MALVKAPYAAPLCGLASALQGDTGQAHEEATSKLVGSTAVRATHGAHTDPTHGPKPVYHGVHFVGHQAKVQLQCQVLDIPHPLSPPARSPCFLVLAACEQHTDISV